MTNPNMAEVTPVVESQSNSELTLEQKEVEGLSQGQIVRSRFLRHRGAMIACAVLACIILLVFTSVGVVIPIPKIDENGFGFDQWASGGWWPYTWNDINPIVNAGKPTMEGLFAWGEHPFGQDDIGRDIFARVMRGTQQSLTVMVVYGLLATLIGITIGGIAGFFRGWVDNVLMRLTDLFLVIPVLVFAAVIGQLAGQNPFFRAFGALSLAILLGLVGWTGMARLVRGEFLTLREREFVDAARVAGASSTRIIFRHILPNALGVVIVSSTLLMAAAIILEAVLSFLGFGVLPPDVSLGQIVNEYQSSFATRPWLFWFPAAFVVSIALCINFIGDGLRDAFDPRQRKMPGTGMFSTIGRMFGGGRGQGVPEPVMAGAAGVPTGASIETAAHPHDTADPSIRSEGDVATGTAGPIATAEKVAEGSREHDLSELGDAGEAHGRHAGPADGGDLADGAHEPDAGPDRS